MHRAPWGRLRLVALAVAALVVGAGGHAEEDMLVAIGDLQIMEREVGQLDARLHAGDFRGAAQRACLKDRNDAAQYEDCQVDVLRSFSKRFLPSQPAVQHAGAGEQAAGHDGGALRKRSPLALEITSLVDNHLDLLEPLGRCLWWTGVCPPHPHLANKLVEESADAYSRFSLSSDRDACLQRARVHWEACGRVIDAPVSVVWRSDTSVTLADADWSDYPVLSSDPHLDDYYTSLKARTGGTWKQIHVWVDESTHRGLGKAAAPPVPSRFVSSELFAQNMDVYETAHGPGVCWTPQRLEKHVDEIYAKWDAAYTSMYDLERMRKTNALASRSSTFPGELDADSIVVAIFEGKRDGYFIELAAFDALLYSNSLALERDYSWQGLCVEANSLHWEGLSHRNCTVVAALVADETGVPLPFDVRRGNDGEAGIVSADTDNVEKNRLSLELKSLHTVSIEKVRRMRKRERAGGGERPRGRDSQILKAV